MIPTVLVTAGDPCGIGPEVILKSVPASAARRRLIVIGDAGVFQRAASRLKLRAPSWRPLTLADDPARLPAGCYLADLQHRAAFHPGRSTAQAGGASLAYLDAAIAWLKSGRAQALVTAPITKWAVQRVAPSFEGHTEYLAAAFRRPDVVMSFVSPRLRVALLTRHVALRDVARHVTPARIVRTVRMLERGLRAQFGLRRPRLAVCGLNPHAGEAGLFGDEERRVLAPALQRLRRAGISIDGPFSADGFFATRHPYDAVVCWYHDQGLIPFKLLARDKGCQVTFGLPFARTSPDHGSALDLAARGGAQPGSMRYALRLAETLAAHAHQS